MKRDSNAGVFLWILPNFYEQLFYRTPPLAASALNFTLYFEFVHLIWICELLLIMSRYSMFIYWHTEKLGPGTRNSPPGTWNPICGTLFKEQIRGTKVRKPILFIGAQFFVFFLINTLELSSQFFIIAKWFQINTC